MKKLNLKSTLYSLVMMMSLSSFVYLNLQDTDTKATLADGKLKIEQIIESTPDIMADFSLMKVFIYIVKGAS